MTKDRAINLLASALANLLSRLSENDLGPEHYAYRQIVEARDALSECAEVLQRKHNGTGKKGDDRG